MVISNMCTLLCGTILCTIRDAGNLLGKFSSSLIDVKIGQLHYRSLEKGKSV